jgi:hypothetical protein
MAGIERQDALGDTPQKRLPQAGAGSKRAFRLLLILHCRSLLRRERRIACRRTRYRPTHPQKRTRTHT